MSEQNQQPEPVEQVQQVEIPPVEPTPPWGDEEANFDAEKAWKLIQNLRAERNDLKDQLAPLNERLREIDEANLTAEQKVARELEDAQASTLALQSENALLKAAMEYGLTNEDLALLEGLPADVVADRAKALSERLRPQGGGLPQRPKPGLLQGGSQPGQEPELSAKEIVDIALR